ncbi:thiamine biosynthesis protein ThiF [Actinotalea sp. C106]|uniref:thiamine biosynthesis protein ThiF n=1 Tax=Actinotalea sp. C106 TaxID=2908644 RepID=UPI002027BBF8|nr:thiamine biosynthesis protein ThiF [Actinotalea sp. C106]
MRGDDARQSTGPRLRPGVEVLWCDTTTVQLGTDDRWAVRLSDLSPASARALMSVPRGADAPSLRRALRAEGVDPRESDEVLAHLTASRLLLETTGTRSSPEELTWSLLTEDGDPRPVLAPRAGQVVRVCGLGRTGLGIAAGLAAGGVGTLELDDDLLVGPHDTGAGGFTARDVGTVRSAAAARVLHDVAPTVRTAPPRSGRRGGRSSGPPDLVVLVEHGAADPVRHRPWLRESVDHLSVVLREASVLVGPLVRPGRGPCLHCVDLHRAEQDPYWPTVAAQLALGGTRSRRGEETVIALTAAALATGQVLAHLDGLPATTHTGALEVRLPEAVPRGMGWPVHPDCGCTGLVTDGSAGELTARV